MLNKIKIEDIIEISKLAGQEILEIYKQDFDVYTKNDASPLTAADKNANDIIIANLKKKYPEIPFISEEMKNLEYSDRKEWEYCWVIDPLDGTKEFVKKNGEFTVNIALIRNGVSVLGVIYIPVKDEVFYAIENKGTFKIDANNNKTKLPKIDRSISKNKIIVVASRSHLSETVVSFVDELKQQGKEVEFLSAGSSLKFCLVAEGKADIYPRLAPTMEWDTAAANVICTEVGLEVINHETNKALTYNKKNLLNPWFIVS